MRPTTRSEPADRHERGKRSGHKEIPAPDRHLSHSIVTRAIKNVKNARQAGALPRARSCKHTVSPGRCDSDTGSRDRLGFGLHRRLRDWQRRGLAGMYRQPAGQEGEMICLRKLWSAVSRSWRVWLEVFRMMGSGSRRWAWRELGRILSWGSGSW